MTLTCVGRSFYTPTSPSPISGGAEVWLGYYQSLRATQGGLTLNVDMSAMAFVRSMPMVRSSVEYREGHFVLKRVCVEYSKLFIEHALELLMMTPLVQIKVAHDPRVKRG